MGVNKKKGRPSSDKSKLSPEVIVRAARRLQTKNAKVPSIRMVARELEIDAMALYHYFPSKAELLEAVSISLVKEIYEPKASENWQVELLKLCQSYLHLLQKHPGLLESMLSISVEGPAQVFADRLGIALSHLNLGEEDATNSLSLLADYLHGYALAMQCDKEGVLNVEMLEGPLNLYMLAIDTLSKHSK